MYLYFLFFLLLLIPIYIGVVWWLTERIPHLDLRGKNVIITGGSSGIGYSTAQEMIKRGVSSIALIARTQSKLDDAKKQLEIYARTTKNTTCAIYVYSADVSNVTRMVDIVQEYKKCIDGNIDIVLANAGISCPDLFDNISYNNFEETIRINYLGVVATMKAVVPIMKLQKSGRICVVASMAAQFPMTGYSSYAPTKAAAIAFAQVMYMELKPYNVIVQVCNPPDVDTPMYEQEMKTKPQECILMSQGTGVFPSERLANDICNGIETYKWNIYTGFDGLILGTLTAGSAPGGNVITTLLEIALGSVLRLIVLFIRKDFDSIAHKVHSERIQQQQTKTE